MKKLLLPGIIGILCASWVNAQIQPSNYNTGKKQPAKLGIGLKAGANFANVTNASAINAGNRTGFMVAGFFSPPSGGTGMGYRTEVVFSRQGYDYSSNTTTGTVTLDYILLPQLYTINLGKIIQLQLGGQIAFLIKAKADSTKPQSGGNPYAQAMDYYNRFDYGMAAGFEIYPAKGFLLGARYNLSFGKAYKDESSFPTTPVPPFIPPPGTNGKNNVVQVFAGYKF